MNELCQTLVECGHNQAAVELAYREGTRIFESTLATLARSVQCDDLHYSTLLTTVIYYHMEQQVAANKELLSWLLSVSKA